MIAEHVQQLLGPQREIRSTRSRRVAYCTNSGAAPFPRRGHACNVPFIMHVRRSAAGDPRPGREEPSSKIGSDPHQAIRRGSYCTIIIVTTPGYGCVMLQLPACVSPARSPVFWSSPIPGERPGVDSSCVCPNRQVARQPIYPGQMRAEEHRGLVWGNSRRPLQGRSTFAFFIWAASSSSGPRMQVRRGTPMHSKSFHCNHAEHWAG